MPIQDIMKISNVTETSADIRIYGDIVASEWDMWDGSEVTPKMIQDHLATVAGKDINVYINSPGGSVFAGVQIHNELQRHNGRLTVHIDGVAASIASVIALSGKIVMPDNAMMMVHKPLLGGTRGNAKELREQAEMLDKVFESMMAVYGGRLKKPESAEEFIQMCDNETWLTAQEVADLFTDVEVTKSYRAVAVYSNEFMATLQQEKVPQSLQVLPEVDAVKIDEPVKKKEVAPTMTIEEIRAALEAGEVKPDELKALIIKEGETVVEAKSVKLVEALGEYKTVQAVETLKAEAEHGRKYMADLIDTASQERVKAQGDLFTPEMADKYKAMLARVGDIDTIKEEIDLYQKQVQASFTPGRAIAGNLDKDEKPTVIHSLLKGDK